MRRRGFRLLFAGQAISLLGDGIAPVALTFAVLGLTSDPAVLGIVLALRGVLNRTFASFYRRVSAHAR